MATTHKEQLEFLRKIEGQVRGVQKMVEQERDCVDIITQINSIIGALRRVEDEMFKKHVNGCVVGAFKGKTEVDTREKVDELVGLIKRFRKSG